MTCDVFLSLGSNMGNREKNLSDAVRLISSLDGCSIVKVSNIYETEPVGYTEQGRFLNMAVWMETELGPEDLLKELQKIEGLLKRARNIHWGPRTIDIDILLFGNVKIDCPRLKIPHPRMFERAFVLVPLKDIYPDKSIGGFDLDVLIKRCGAQKVSLYRHMREGWKTWGRVRNADVYYHIPSRMVDEVVECGLKLSKWFDREVFIEGEPKRCISAFLNPMDDSEKFASDDFTCIRIQVSTQHCYVADRYLYLLGQNNPELMGIYTDTVVPVERYVFGTYRLPECLVTSTIIGEDLSVVDSRIGSPVLFESSEGLYVNNVMETLKETYKDISDAMLYYFYNNLAQIKKIDKIEDVGRRIAVFFDRENHRTITVKVPDIENYLLPADGGKREI